MKFITCEMQRIAFAAFLLGVFALNPMARADDSGQLDTAFASPAPTDTAPQLVAATTTVTGGKLEDADKAYEHGMTLDAIRQVSSGFDVRLQGTKLLMDGTILRKCVADADGNITARFEVKSVPADADANTPAQHQIRFIPGPDCDSPKKGDKSVNLSALFGTHELPNASFDGSICLVHNNAGPDQCDDIPGRAYSANAKKAKAQKLAADEQAAADQKIADRKQKEMDAHKKALEDKIKVLCSNGDFEGIGAEIQAQKAFLGNVTSILDKVDTYKKKYYTDQMAKATDADTLKNAYQGFLDAANEKGWDTDEATNSFVDKRSELLNALIADNDKSAASKAAAIRDMASDFRDNGLMSEKVGSDQHTGKELIGAAYYDLGNNLRDNAGTSAQSLGLAETYYRASEEFGTMDQKAKAEATIAKMYDEAADQCLAEAKDANKGLEKCDALAKKAKKAMDLAIKDQAHVKGDDSLEALSAMRQEKIARFGLDDGVVDVSGYGIMNQMGGTYDKTKLQDYQLGQQQFLMKMMMQQRFNGGMGGVANTPSGGSSGSYF